ncbi:MAG: hypothetical protein ACK559_41765, partial [bacterium]
VSWGEGCGSLRAHHAHACAHRARASTQDIVELHWFAPSTHHGIQRQPDRCKCPQLRRRPTRAHGRGHQDFPPPP